MNRASGKLHFGKCLQLISAARWLPGNSSKSSLYGTQGCKTRMRNVEQSGATTGSLLKDGLTPVGYPKVQHGTPGALKDGLAANDAFGTGAPKAQNYVPWV